MCAIVRSERAANESITSMAVTSTMMPCAPEAADLLHEVVAEPFGVGVGERGLHRGDQDRALFQDWYWHAVPALVVFTRFARRCG